MAFSQIDRFVRLPTALLEALLRARLSGTQWRIIFWMVRQTYGWNRYMTPFSWYRIAQDLSLDRGGAVRAGHELLRRGILRIHVNQARLEPDGTQWRASRFASQGKEAAMTVVSADGSPRKAMTGILASDDKNHRSRCQESSLFRRAKDRCKDRLKTYKERPQRRLLAGAAKPIPGKYDSLSEN